MFTDTILTFFLFALEFNSMAIETLKNSNDKKGINDANTLLVQIQYKL